jgi:D-arabinose 1-dehydrogenase-like Zn-dependent alcohol dehydrogenase
MVLPQGMDMISAAPLFCAGVTGKSEAFQIESLTPRIDVLMIVLSLPCGKGLRA